MNYLVLYWEKKKKIAPLHQLLVLYGYCFLIGVIVNLCKVNKLRLSKNSEMIHTTIKLYWSLVLSEASPKWFWFTGWFSNYNHNHPKLESTKSLQWSHRLIECRQQCPFPRAKYTCGPMYTSTILRKWVTACSRFLNGAITIFFTS